MFTFALPRAPSHLSRLIRDESGAVTVDWTVLTAAGVGLGLIVMGVVATGAGNTTADISESLDGAYIGFLSENFGKTPYDVAAEVELNHFGSRWPQRRMNRLLNDTSEQSLVNQHRRWSNRASDPGYSNPGRAADQLAMIEIAMDARGVER
ncbi:MAG: hypothetical protein AAF919_15655 [Pseudomonadota bacterium]